MRRSGLLSWWPGLVLVLTILAATGSAQAARVLVLASHGQVWVRDDPYLAAFTPTLPPSRPTPATRAHARLALAPPSAHRTVHTVLARLRREGLISASQYWSYLHSLNGAGRALRRLSGTRALELQAVMDNLHSIAARGLLTPSRLPVLFLTLDRNRQWWTMGPLLATWQRVEFAGSRLVWQYYPGQGLELQELGSFSTADALCTSGAQQRPACQALLDELIPLGALRGGALTWEYYFNFDGGVPPWTSAMSQGTALQALADGYVAVRRRSYLTVGARALGIFTRRAPLGVAMPTSRGSRFVQYSFDPAGGDEVINGFLQSLIGLQQFARVSGDPRAARLFAAGSAEAQAEVPQFDTGAWSLYQPGIEDDLSYHQLVTGFLQQLCASTAAAVYCTTADHFEQYLKTPAALTFLTRRVSAGQAASVDFDVSKIARVGITVLKGSSTVFLTSAQFSGGQHSFVIPALAKGSYSVRLDATDLAGNYDQVAFTLSAQ